MNIFLAIKNVNFQRMIILPLPIGIKQMANVPTVVCYQLI